MGILANALRLCLLLSMYSCTDSTLTRVTAGGHTVPCSLVFCPNTSSSVFLSITEKKDGFGAEMMYYLSVIGYIQRRGWNFGGIYVEGEPSMPINATKVVHNVSIVQAIESIFGLGFVTPRHRAAQGGAIKTIVVPGGMSELAALPESTIPRTAAVNYFVPMLDLDFYRTQKHQKWPAGLEDGLRCDAWPGLMRLMRSYRPAYDYYDSTRPMSVVAHMRLGDVAQHRDDCSSKRTVCKEVYLVVLQAIKKVYPTAEFVVQSSTINANSSEDAALKREFQEQGFQLILDDENNASTATSDMLRSVATMATADVLISSRSSFPRTAGVLNPNCEIALRPKSNEFVDERIPYTPHKTSTNELLTSLQRCLSAGRHQRHVSRHCLDK